MKEFLRFLLVIMAICFFKISTDAVEPIAKYGEVGLFADDLENFEKIILGQTEENRNHIAELFGPAKKDLTIFEEIAQNFLVYASNTTNISFKMPTVLVNNSTIYKLFFYKNHLHTITPPPPQV